jgi:hypothetical protein
MDNSGLTQCSEDAVDGKIQRSLQCEPSVLGVRHFSHHPAKPLSVGVGGEVRGCVKPCCHNIIADYAIIMAHIAFDCIRRVVLATGYGMTVTTLRFEVGITQTNKLQRGFVKKERVQDIIREAGRLTISRTRLAGEFSLKGILNARNMTLLNHVIDGGQRSGFIAFGDKIPVRTIWVWTA